LVENNYTSPSHGRYGPLLQMGSKTLNTMIEHGTCTHKGSLPQIAIAENNIKIWHITK
jgi:hypothetical protein